MTPFYENDGIKLYRGDVLDRLREMPDESVNCVVTSPPYWGLRDYGVDGQIGLEPTPAAYLERMVAVFREVRRVLRADGVMFINMGDSYFSDPGKGGSGTFNGRNGRGEGYARGLRAAAYGTSGKGRSNSRPSDCPSENLCDECRDILKADGTLRNAHLHGASPSPSPCESILERTGVALDHPPTSDSAPSVDHIEAASLDQPLEREIPDDGPLSSQESTTHGTSLPQLDLCFHCSNCGACLAVLGSSSRDASLCGRRGEYMSRTSSIESELHNQNRDVLGSAYPYSTSASLKPKDLIGMPWRLAFALQADGWWLRQDIIWSKPNPMPESVTDRCTKAHEYVFLLTKSARYFYDAEAVKEPAVADHAAGNRSHKGATAYLEGDERHRTKQGLVAYAQRNSWNGSKFHDGNNAVTHPNVGKNRSLGEKGETADSSEVRSGKGASFGRGAGWRDDPANSPETRNKRSVWEIATQPYAEAHFATFPTKLVEPCIRAGCPKGGTVLDPFNGSGTTGLVAIAERCNYIGIELNPEYALMSARRFDAATAQNFLAFGD